MTMPGNQFINIFKENWSIINYRSTLGHKFNHSFKRNQAYFGHVFHPRFGPIRSVVARTDIAKGDEIFVNYGYDKRGSVPEWYADLYEHEFGKKWQGKVYQPPKP